MIGVDIEYVQILFGIVVLAVLEVLHPYYALIASGVDLFYLGNDDRDLSMALGCGYPQHISSIYLVEPNFQPIVLIELGPYPTINWILVLEIDPLLGGRGKPHSKKKNFRELVIYSPMGLV